MNNFLENKLDFYIKNNYNVLFKGRHGIGKSSIILDAFQRNSIKYKYFSAATMDPWVDFVGVPKERKGKDGISYIELIRPKDIISEDIEAFFFDEFNRAPKKVRNAVMEILQFKSINGVKLKNLRFIWGAVNPSDDQSLKFDVEELDPAQQDRFQIQIDLPYSLDIKYFSKKYGDTIANVASEWWEKIPEDIKQTVSPRRLDYALELYNIKGDLRDVLPFKSNIGKLLSALNEAPLIEKFNNLFDTKDVDGAKEFLSKDNILYSLLERIKSKKEYKRFFLPCLSPEKLTAFLSSDEDIKKEILSLPETFREVLESFYHVTKDYVLKENIEKVLKISKTVEKKEESFSIISEDIKVTSVVLHTEEEIKKKEIILFTYPSVIDEKTKSLIDKIDYKLKAKIGHRAFRNIDIKPAVLKKAYLFSVNKLISSTSHSKEIIKKILYDTFAIVGSSNRTTCYDVMRDIRFDQIIAKCIYILISQSIYPSDTISNLLTHIEMSKSKEALSPNTLTGLYKIGHSYFYKNLIDNSLMSIKSVHLA